MGELEFLSYSLGKCTNLLTQPNPKTQAFNDAFDYALLVSATRSRLGRLSMLVPNRQFEESRYRVRAFVREYVEEAMALQKKQSDGAAVQRNYVFLTELLKVEENMDTICDQVLAIFLAGRDTTAAALSTLFWTLARDSRVWGKLRQEVMSFESDLPSWEELKNMKYIQWTIKESKLMDTIKIGSERGKTRKGKLTH